MKNLKRTLIASAVAFAAVPALAAEQNGQTAPAQPSKVEQVTAKIVNAVKNGVQERKAASVQDKAKGEQHKAGDYPKIPAKYMRPDVAEKHQKKVAADLKAAAEKVSEELLNSSSTITYDKVKINTGPIIDIKPGENVFIPISREHPNRLLTPFTNPQVVSTTLQGGRKGECGEVCVRDGVIYITTDNPNAVTAFITEKGHEDIAFSVTMVPQAIPPREVRFSLPGSVLEQLKWSKDGRSAKKAEAWEVTQPYVETLKLAMRTIALGQVPDGYTLRNVRRTDKLPVCAHPGLDINFAGGQILEGFNLNLFVGVITNVSDRPVEFRNQRCGNWHNAAVTSWPLTRFTAVSRSLQ